MQTFLVERPIPPRFDVNDSDAVALHSRWAVDAYRQVGAMWLGGVITEERMFSLVVAEAADDLRRYREALRISDDDTIVRRVVRANGPYFALPQGDAGYRPPFG